MYRVLIVDDEPDVRELVKITLNRAELETLSAENGKKAIETVEKEKPDLILLDINMPRLDGWETLEKMSERNWTKEIPVMMFTVEKLTFVKMLRKDLENLVGYIEKPFTRTELVETVKSTLDRTKTVYKLRDKIVESTKEGEYLADAFVAWNRTQMIHERVLDKLREMEEKFVEEQKLARIRNLMKGEEHTIKEAKRKKVEILKSAGIQNFISG